MAYWLTVYRTGYLHIAYRVTLSAIFFVDIGDPNVEAHLLSQKEFAFCEYGKNAMEEPKSIKKILSMQLIAVGGEG